MYQKTCVFSSVVIGASDFKIEPPVLQYVELVVMSELADITDGEKRVIRGWRPTTEPLNNIAGAPRHPLDYRRS